MSVSTRGLVAIAAALALASLACGGSEPVKVGLDPSLSGETFGLVNRSESTWSEVDVRVTGDSRSGACLQGVVDSWRPGETHSFPRCGDRTVVALNVDGKDAFFVVAPAARRELSERPSVDLRSGGLGALGGQTPARQQPRWGTLVLLVPRLARVSSRVERRPRV